MPIAWFWVAGSRGHCTTQAQIDLLGYVATLLPERVTVSLVGDCEFGNPLLIEYLDYWGWARGSIWYLATIEDLATRQIIGKHHDSHLVLATLHQAFATGQIPQIFHSDQGNEFMAQRCTDYLENRGVQISVSNVASPWQNGYVESFYGRFKQELGDLNRFDTVGEMIAAIYQHIHYYNHDRIHTVLKLPPAVYAAHTFSDTCLQKTST